MRRWLAVAILVMMGAAAFAWFSARPVAVAAVGDRAVAAYRFLGRTWLVPLAPRGLWALPVPGSTHVAAADQLFVIAAGGDVRVFTFGPGRPATAAAGAIGAEPVRRAAAADLDGDGNPELVLIRGEPVAPPPEQRPGLGAALEVWAVDGGTLRRTFRGLEKHTPWQASAGDVDGDGKPELAVGTWGMAAYDQRWAERPWLYRWKADQPYALWLGSRLAHPFADFTLAGAPAFLVATEATRDGGQALGAYSWSNGFGFTLDYTGPSEKQIRQVWTLPPSGPGCAALAALVEPGPQLVLLSYPPAAEGSLVELARRPVAGDVQVAGVPGRVWILTNQRIESVNSCCP